MDNLDQLPRNLKSVIGIVKTWEKFDNFISALLFGSVARGEYTEGSDLDLFIVTSKERADTSIKRHLNRIQISEIPVDIVFMSLGDFIKLTTEQLNKHDFLPQIIDSIIVFDKTNKLALLKEEAKLAGVPKKYTIANHPTVYYALYDVTEPIERYLKSDPMTSLLLMHLNLEILIKYFYRLNGKWQVPTKKVLRDLKTWDGNFAQLLENLISAPDLKEKVNYWTNIIEYIKSKMPSISYDRFMNCTCEECLDDIKLLN